MRPDSYYAENGIELRLGTKATGIDKRGRAVELADGTKLGFDRLLLATGAEPVRLLLPGRRSAPVSMSCARSPTAGRSSKGRSRRSARW